MFWYLLIAALVNVGLGYGVALAISRSQIFRAPVRGRDGHSWEDRVDAVHASSVSTRPAVAAVAASPPAVAEEAAVAPPEPSPLESPRPAPLSTVSLTDSAPRKEVPSAWLEMLDDSLQTDSFVEAAAHVVRLDVSRYREELVRIDQVLRAEAEQLATAYLEQLQQEVLRANQDWIVRQSAVVAHLQFRRESSPLADEAAVALEAALLDQAAHIRDVCRAMARHDALLHPAAAGGQLLAVIRGLIDHCHSLRDRTQESLVAVLRREDRLGSLKPALQVDALTTLRSRAALEMMLESWWHDDPLRHRLASVALIDIDRQSDVNRQYGPLVGDRLICSLAELASEGFRRNRGYDVLGRFAGQQLLAFLGDTGPQGATTAVERLRQMVEATIVCLDGVEVPLRISCGVTEILPKDTAATLLRRAQSTLNMAKTAGGNQTCLNMQDRPAPLTPSTFSVVLPA